MRHDGKPFRNFKKNPLYQIMLGSRELFHSNFIGWLFENYPSCIAEVLSLKDLNISPSSKNTSFEISREKNSIDLLMEFNGLDRAIVIENKFKDSVKPNQLEKYFSKVKKRYKKIDFFVLSLFPTNKIYIPSPWKQRSYNDFVEALNSWRKKPKTLIISIANISMIIFLWLGQFT